MIKCHTAPDTLVAQVAVAITPKLDPNGTIAITSICNKSSSTSTSNTIKSKSSMMKTHH